MIAFRFLATLRIEPATNPLRFLSGRVNGPTAIATTWQDDQGVLQSPTRLSAKKIEVQRRKIASAYADGVVFDIG
jgi:hypothetical protein